MRFHLFHNWSKWSEYNHVKIYDSANTDIPVDTFLIVVRTCSVCNLQNFKRIKL